MEFQEKARIRIEHWISHSDQHQKEYEKLDSYEMKIVSSGNNQLDVWGCGCGTYTPVKRGSPKPTCEYCRRVNEKNALESKEVKKP